MKTNQKAQQRAHSRVSGMLPLLGVNLDHIATLRQLRGTPYPDLLEAARRVEWAGGHQITVHLREDRRHIQDADVKALKKSLKIALNLEMAVTDEMVRFATQVKPNWVCLVPEKRQELTTEGGLDLRRNPKKARSAIQKLQKAGIHVSLFIEPSDAAVEAAAELGADAVELHTGAYCRLTQEKKVSKTKVQAAILRIRRAGLLAQSLGLRVHAGHGFDAENVRPIVELTDSQGRCLIEEYNIGHFIVCRAAQVGLERAVREMLSAIHAP